MCISRVSVIGEHYTEEFQIRATRLSACSADGFIIKSYGQWRHKGGCHPGRQLRVSPLFFTEKNWRPFLLITPLFLILLGCHPQTVSPRTFFLPLRPRLSTILCKFAHNFFSFRCHPLEDVTRSGPSPASPLVTPLTTAHRSTAHGSTWSN